MGRRSGGLPFDLGEVLKGVGDLLELVARMSEEGKSEVTYSGALPGVGGPKGLHGVYGFNVRIGAGGRPRVESFGNLRRDPQGPVLDDRREPLVDVFDEGSDIVVIAEVPGIDESEIRLSLAEDRLRIQARGRDRQYEKEIELPTPVSGPIRSAFRNGLLQVTLRKAGG